MSLETRAKVLWVSAAVIRAALVMWVLEGLAFLGFGMLAWRHILDAGRLVQDLPDWISLYIQSQTWAGLAMGVAIMVRISLRADPLTGFRFAWLHSVLSFLLLGITLFQRIHLSQYEFICRADALAGTMVVRRSNVDPKAWVSSERAPEPGWLSQAMRESYVQIGLLMSAGFLSAFILLFLNLREFWEEKGGGAERPRGRREPPWRLPRKAGA